MRENVTVSHRGASYEIGRGQLFYGIWPTTSQAAAPLEWWPETDEGWYAAWFRFTQLESPGSIMPVDIAGQHAEAGLDASWPNPSLTSTNMAAASAPGLTTTTMATTTMPKTAMLASVILLGLGVGCGIAGLFGGYLGGASLASSAADVLPHAIYLAAWTVAAALLFLGGRLGGRPDGRFSSGRSNSGPSNSGSINSGRFSGGSLQRAGALLAAGVSAVTLGFFLADLGEVASGSATSGSGLILSFLGWLACAIGSAVAVWPRPGSMLGKPERRGHQVAPLITVILAGLGAAITFAPAWDSFTIQTAAGATQTVTQGNAFGFPAAVIAGNVVVMLAVVMVIVAAGLWRPGRAGAVLLAGAAVPLVAQALSALVGAAEPASPALFGISRGEATALGITITSGVTLAFWIYCLFLLALALSCALLATGPDQLATNFGQPLPAAPGQAQPGRTQPGQTQPGFTADDQTASGDTPTATAGDVTTATR